MTQKDILKVDTSMPNWDGVPKMRIKSEMLPTRYTTKIFVKQPIKATDYSFYPQIFVG